MDNKLISLNGKIFAQIGGVVKKTPTQINILQNPTITEAEGTAEPLELSKIIKNLNISDIIVNKDGNSLSEGYHYNLSNLNTKFPIVTFTANAVLTSESILTIEIIKSGYIVNSKQPIEIINQI